MTFVSKKRNLISPCYNLIQKFTDSSTINMDEKLMYNFC